MVFTQYKDFKVCEKFFENKRWRVQSLFIGSICESTLGKEIRVKFGKYYIITLKLGLEVIKILIAQ